jgi:type II pantothenate kinase
MNLNGAMVASSFGKLVMKDRPTENLKEEDVAIALLMLITNNIGQVAFLNAKLHNCTKIFFVGSFLRYNSISCRRLAFAIDFWSGKLMEALFLEHEGYFGALGTFLYSAYGQDTSDLY